LALREEYRLMSRRRESDADLLARVPAPDAVGELYERHVDAVFGFAVRRARNPEDVADLVATVFLELFAAASGFDRRRGDVRPWLLGIAARCLADQRRAGYRRVELTQRLESLPQFRDDEYDRVEQMIDAARHTPAVERALKDNLTAAERELFMLVADDGLSVADAARCIGLTPVAGRMRLARARRKLKAALASSPVGRVTEIPIEGGSR
jgi:RNA polymerase sigma-70 factor (ECF subfamily)